MFDVIANMAESTLSRRKPTRIAMKMIMAGSIRFVTTRKAEKELEAKIICFPKR